MRKALIAWGGWEGHEPEAGRARGSARCWPRRASRSIDARRQRGLRRPGLADFSLIVPILTMSKIEKEELANLAAAVKGGVGLGGYHGGMARRVPRTSPSTSSWSAASGSRIPATSSTTAST